MLKRKATRIEDELAYELEGIEKFSNRSVPAFYKNATKCAVRSQTTAVRKEGGRWSPPDAFDTQRHSFEVHHFIRFRKYYPNPSRPRLPDRLRMPDNGNRDKQAFGGAIREIGETMLRHLRGNNKIKPSQSLESWLESKVPTMLGIECFILLALRYALENKDEQARNLSDAISGPPMIHCSRAIASGAVWIL